MKIIDKKFVYAASILVVLGIISGIIFIFLIGSLDKMIVKNELTNYLEGLSERLKWTSWFVGHYHLDKSFGRYRLLYDDILEVIK